MTVLEAADVTFRYPDGTQALTEVSVRVERGEIVAVLGPSGAGKSTLFKCFAGLERPSAGAVAVEGVELAALHGRERRLAQHRIGLVFQEFHLVGRASVLSNVLVGRLATANAFTSLFHWMSRADRTLAVELLTRVGLGEQVRKRADSLSGGQRQRVALARALSQRPELLLADEPVANLDPVLAAGVIDDIVRMVREEGLTAVLNLHDVSLARRVAQRVVGMREGRIVFDLPVGEVTDPVLADLYANEELAANAADREEVAA
ncbi:phosphonate ABC transporter ATP-binding protein [Demequina gelatinilytica]|uniref:phosphonate ABC transporter ATP-binding protein n=1 Tax=Demequina gelatinilytica TaxID=1638980 RepID=UPI0007808C1B|nr:phosphonate ABC transporter ATP-binding protein [Demequina gelatinilytica]